MPSSARCAWYGHRSSGSATAKAALFALLVVGWPCAPAPALPLLYLNTGRSLQVIDAGTGAPRKVIVPPDSSSITDAVQVAAAGRLYIAASGAAGALLLVVDPDRNIADTFPLPSEVLGSGISSMLRAAADGTALYFPSDATDSAGAGLTKLDLGDEVASTISNAAFGSTSGCRGRRRQVCSDAPPCPCDELVDFVVPPGGRTIHALRHTTVGTVDFRSFASAVATSRRLVHHFDLVAIDSSSGETLLTSPVAPSRSFFLGGASLALLPDGERALVQVAEGDSKGERTTLVSLALASGLVEKSMTVDGELLPVAVAHEQARLYATVAFSPTVLVLDARPTSLFQQIGTISLGGPHTAALSSVAISPRGDRIAATVVRGARRVGGGVQASGPPSLVIADTERATVVADLPLAPREAGNSYIILDGCSDRERCFCTVDADCDDHDPCNVSSCRGGEGCAYLQRSCFGGALCLLRTTSTTLPMESGPGSPEEDPQCQRLLVPLERLDTRIRSALEAASALPPGTPPASYRRALVRAKALVKKRIAAELRIVVLPPRIRTRFPTEFCLIGSNFRTQVEILTRLREARRNLAACAARGD